MISSEALTLRGASAGDASRIAELLTDEGYPVGPTDVAARIARFEGPDAAVIVAEQAGEVIGFIAIHAVPRFEHDDRFVRVLAVVVDAGARERGVGHRLMAEAESFGREHQAAFVEITAGHHRPEARQLYEALGFDGAVTAYLRKRIE